MRISAHGASFPDEKIWLPDDEIRLSGLAISLPDVEISMSGFAITLSNVEICLSEVEIIDPDRKIDHFSTRFHHP